MQLKLIFFSVVHNHAKYYFTKHFPTVDVDGGGGGGAKSLNRVKKTPVIWQPQQYAHPITSRLYGTIRH